MNNVHISWMKRLVLVATVTLTACSGDGSDTTSPTTDPSAAASSTVAETQAPAYAPAPLAFEGVGEAVLEGPITGGLGVPVIGTGAFDSSGFEYGETEYFISGTANSYTSAEPLSEDG